MCVCLPGENKGLVVMALSDAAVYASDVFYTKGEVKDEWNVGGIGDDAAEPVGKK